MPTKINIKKNIADCAPEWEAETENPEILAAFCCIYAHCNGNGKAARNMFRAAIGDAATLGIATVKAKRD